MPKRRSRALVAQEPSQAAVEKAAMNLLGRYGQVPFSAGGGVREPFLQAWQKNLDGTGINAPASLLAVSGVYACAMIISQDVSKLPLELLRNDERGLPTLAVNHPIANLFRKPNNYQTMMDFVQYFVACRCITGNAYAYKELDQRGVTRAVHVVHPNLVIPMVEPTTKSVFYAIKESYDEALMSPDDLPPDRIVPSRFMIHDRMNVIWHPLVGVSPIYAAAASAQTAGRIMINSENFFGNMSRPSGVLTSTQTIGQVTADRLKQEWGQRYSNGNIGKTAVLGDGLSFQPVIMSATDAQLIEQLRWTIEDIARVFRVPMYLLGDPSKASMRNSETLAQAYYQGCLQYHIEGIERRLDRDLDLAADHHTNFDLDALFRMETDTRFETYQKGIQSGVLSINEARAKEGLPPVKGGEVPRIQMQYVPIDQPVQQQAPLNGGPDNEEDDPVDDDPDVAPADDEDDDDEDVKSARRLYLEKQQEDQAGLKELYRLGFHADEAAKKAKSLGIQKRSLPRLALPAITQ